MEDCRVFAIQLLNVFGKSNERVNENAFANIGNVKAFFLFAFANLTSIG